MSTYSSSLRIELPSDGTQAGTWGDTTNNNLAYVLDSSIAGYQTVSVTAASQALTYTNGPTSIAASNQSVYAMLQFTTTTGAAFAVYAPPASKAYIVWNNSGQSMTLRVSDVIGSTTAISGNVALTIANGNKVLVWSDAVSFYEVQASNLTGVLAVANGGTGVTTSTGSGSVVLSTSPTLGGTPAAPTAAIGTDSTQIATTAFVRDIIPTGVITMWYGSIASIPTGWYLCDGTNSTPDLRDRFIVGAGSTYAVAATGGSANATLVSHTHTATSTSTFTGTALGTHTHTLTDNGHTHSTQQAGLFGGGGLTFTGGGYSVSAPPTLSSTTGITIASASAGTPAGTVATTTSNSTEGSSATNANLPPYYALAYIMKA
tara:strand:+ start:3627 stop:4748 length:1122 start_codon:yes stop_codon:yes gene_type:complete